MRVTVSVCDPVLSWPAMQVSDRFRYRYLPRILWSVGIVAVVVVAAVVSINLFSSPSTDKETIVSIPDETTAPVAPPIARTTIPAEAKAVILKFVKTAVTRENTDGSWDLVVPAMRQGYTRKQWAAGEIPVVPYVPIGGARYQVAEITRDDMQVDIGLFPKAGDKTKPASFVIQMHHTPSGWKVTNWVPAGQTIVPGGD